MSEIKQRFSADLTGRQAYCCCGHERPSSAHLPRFEYCGPGSRSAEEVCVCGYHRLAHHAEIREGAVSPTLRNCPGFRARGDLGFDSYWCGCRADESELDFPTVQTEEADLFQCALR